MQVEVWKSVLLRNKLINIMEMIDILLYGTEVANLDMKYYTVSRWLWVLGGCYQHPPCDIMYTLCVNKNRNSFSFGITPSYSYDFLVHGILMKF